jgi:hypothetical protein
MLPPSSGLKSVDSRISLVIQTRYNQGVFGTHRKMDKERKTVRANGNGPIKKDPYKGPEVGNSIFL